MNHTDGLLVTYEIDKSASNVIVRNVLNIGEIEFSEGGSYKMPEIAGDHHFVRQLGIVSCRMADCGDVTHVYLQQPHGIFLPGSGYGPFRMKEEYPITMDVYRKVSSGNRRKFMTG